MSQISDSADFECFQSRVLNEIIIFRTSIEEHFNKNPELQKIGSDVNSKLEEMFYNIQFELGQYQTQIATARTKAENQAKSDQQKADWLLKIQTLSAQISLHIAAMSQNHQMKK